MCAADGGHFSPLLSLPAMDAAASFDAFLTSLMHPDNRVRGQAEAKFNQLKDANPAMLVENLLRQLQQPPGSQQEQQQQDSATLRAFSAVLLRGLIGRRGTAYKCLTPMMQVQLRAGLLSVALATAAERDVSKKVCDTIGELGIVVEATGHWGELLPWCLQCVNTSDPKICEVGLTVLAQVAMVMANNTAYHPHYQQLSTLLQRCLTAPGAGLGVRVAAVQTVANLVVCIPHSNQRAIFRPLVPAMLHALGEVLSNDATTLKSAEVLECFGDVTFEHASFYRRHLAQVHSAMVQIAGTAQLDDKLRRLAVEWLAATAESSGSMCRKLAGDAYTRGVLPVLLSMMLANVDEMVGDLAAWEARGEVATGDGGIYGDDSDITNFDVALSAIERLGRAIGAKKFVPVVFQMLGGFLSSADWRSRFVGLMALAPITPVLPSESLDTVMAQIKRFFHPSTESDPRVRCAACDVVGMLSMEEAHGHVFQAAHHELVIVLLQQCLSDPTSPRVQSRGAASFISFLECCEEEYILPHLQTLLTVLFERLRHGKRVVQAQAVTAIASVAECASRSFGEDDDDDEWGPDPFAAQPAGPKVSPLAQYYPHVMPTLKQILQTCHEKTDRLFRARALECATLFGTAVDKQQFGPDALQIMQFMHHQQKAGLAFDDPLRSYMLQAWARIGRCLGSDFQKYLHMIMPSLLEAAAMEAEIHVVPGDTAAEAKAKQLGGVSAGTEEEKDPLKYTVNVGDRMVTIHTSALDEKTTAMQMLGTLAYDMKGVFAPYVETVMKIAGPLTLMSGTVHDDLRTVALSVLPSLVNAVNAAGERQKVTVLFQHCVAQLLIAIDQEQEMDVLKTAAQALKETVLSACRPDGQPENNDFSQSVPMMDATQLKTIFSSVVKSMRQSLQRRAVRKAARAVAEDFDEEDAEMDELANESEHELLFYLHEAIGAVVKTHGNTFLPAFTEEVMPLMQQMSQPNSLESDRKMVIFIYDDVVEFGGAQVQQTLLPVMFPAFLEATSPHEQRSLRQGGAYGIGVSASSGGQFFTPYATTAAQALVACISTPDAFDSANGPASDNCVSALGKCIAYHAAHLPNARLLMVQVSRSPFSFF